MSVVLRCPNCGTTQATGGECEACHQAQVRPFCTNHEPGLWLAGQTCAACEARRAEAARARAPSPPLDRATRHSAAPSAPSGVPVSAPSSSPLIAPTVAATAWGALASRLARSGSPAEWESPTRKQAGGCLVRLALFALLLIIIVVIALLVLGRSLALTHAFKSTSVQGTALSGNGGSSPRRHPSNASCPSGLGAGAQRQ